MPSCTIISSCESHRNASPVEKDYQEAAVRLTRSIRNNGGVMSKSTILMWHGEAAPPQEHIRKKLEDYGCIFVSSKAPYPDMPLFNKIVAINNKIDTDYGLWMDSDVYVAGDFSEIIKGDLAAAPTTMSHHRWARAEDNALWKQLYDLCDVPYPGPKMKTHIDQREGNFYLCSGLILFRNNTPFPQVYYDIARRIVESGIPSARKAFTQTALSLAVLKSGMNYWIISEKYHYVYAMHGHALNGSPAIIHYQDDTIVEIPQKDWMI